MLVESFEGIEDLQTFLATITRAEVVAITQAGSWYALVYEPIP